MSDSSKLKDPQTCIDFYKYMMHEYPAEMLKPDRGFHLQSRHDIKNLAAQLFDTQEKQISAERFYKCRIRSIKWTSWYYIMLAAFHLVQIVFFSVYILTAGIDASNATGLLFKVVGLALCCGSFSAWRKQLWRNEEFYGWVLNDFSRDEPIYETLKWIKSDTARVILGDWFKNRPSLTYLLSVSLAILNLHKLPGTASLFSALSPLNSWLCEAAIGSICLMISLPIITDLRFFIEFYKNKETKEDHSPILSVVFVVFILLVTFIFLPTLITSVIGKMFGELFAFLVLFLVIALVFSILFIVSFYLMDNYRQKDGKNSKLFQDQLRTKKEGGETDINYKTFGDLSCSGQIQLLKLLHYNREFVSDSLDIEKLLGYAKTPQVMEMILAFYN